MAKLTNKKIAENAIRWIDNLQYYKKTTGLLGQKVDGVMKYCCLGVGCRVLDVKVDFDSGTSQEFADLVGLASESGEFPNAATINDAYCYSLVDVNDDAYDEDRGFKNVKAAILSNLDKVFIEPIAKILIKHYQK